MDLNLIRVFVGIYETQSLTATAQQLFVTQSAVSQSLARLRASLNDELFVREGRSMTPTPFAISAYPQFRDALQAVERITSRVEPFDPATTTRVFRIALSELGEVGWLANIVAEIRERAPRARIEAVHLERDAVAEWLRRGTVDLAVAPVDIPGELKRTSVKRQGYRLVFSDRHPLAESEVTLKQLVDLPRVDVPSDSGAPQLAAFQRGSATYREPAVVAQHFASIPPLLQAQPDLVAIVPESIGEAWAQAWPLVAKPLPFSMPALELSVYQRSTSGDQDALEWLTQAVLRAIVTLPEHFETISGLDHA